MYKKVIILILIVAVFIACGSYLAARTSSRALSKSEILALVSGAIIPENIAFDIRSRGIAFVPDESFRKLLQSAGATESVLAALGSAKSSGTGKPESEADQALLQHLSHAGALIHAGQDEQAAGELNSALTNGTGRNEIGFVMGEILIQQGRVDQVGEVYSEILSQNPNFPKFIPG
jgi:hypothetical protein